MQERTEIAYRCPNCGLRIYGDQVKFIYGKISPNFHEAETIIKAECTTCGSKELIPVVIDADEYHKGCRKANGEEPFDDMWDKWSKERVEKIYNNSSQEKLERLKELLDRYHRLESLIILEYFDGSANGTDESTYRILWEVHDVIKQAIKDGKIKGALFNPDDEKVCDSMPYSVEDVNKAVRNVINGEKC